jgi:hypothetical protein
VKVAGYFHKYTHTIFLLLLVTSFTACCLFSNVEIKAVMCYSFMYS